MKRPQSSERGSVIVEFLLVFPAFIVLAMFVLEASLMWSDRHIERLAAFEAARALVSSSTEFGPGGVPYPSPCEAPNAMKRAKQAALRKIAIIAPPVPLVIARLGKAVPQVDFGVTGGGNAGDAMLRLAKRWPTAVASTELTCVPDREKKSLTVKLTYHRMLQTPLVDRIIYVVYRLGQVNKSSPVKLSLDENFLAVTADGDATPAVAEMRKALKDSFSTVKTLGLSGADAVNFMRDVPGVDHVFAQVTPAPTDVAQVLKDSESGARNDGLAALNGAVVDQQSKLLTGMVAMVPEALRRIPMMVEVTMQQDAFTGRTVTAPGAGRPVHEPIWDGKIKGVFNMEPGSGYRDWGVNMSSPKGNLRDKATALENL